MIAVVNCGVGNLGSLVKALARLGLAGELTDDPARIREARRLILPGVGAFGAVADGLRQRGILPVLAEAVAAGTPLLGICLGMHLLFERSAEDPQSRGLGIFPGRVERLPGGQKVPQMGWNTVRQARPSPLFSGISDGAYFYFVHSYYPVPQRAETVLGTTGYGVEFASVVGEGKVFGVQFHPEKSAEVGLRLLKNFVELI